jgi:hypothetical protein
MRSYHTSQVEGITILALADEDNGYNTIKLTAEQKASAGLKGRSFFGHIARHRVVRDGKLTGESVTVGNVGRSYFIIG